MLEQRYRRKTAFSKITNSINQSYCILRTFALVKTANGYLSPHVPPPPISVWSRQQSFHGFKEMHGKQDSMQIIAFAVPPVWIPKYTFALHDGTVNVKKSLLAHRSKSYRIVYGRRFIGMTNKRFSSVETIEWLETPITVSGKVQRGFGRGSRDLGTPTANLPGNLVDGVGEVKRDGVYLGYGIVPKYGPEVVKMVANLGRNITYGDVEERVLEAYLMTDEYDEEFYGEEMRLCIIGFLRPEWKLSSLEELIAHIRNDVTVSEAALNLPAATAFRSHPSLKA